MYIDPITQRIFANTLSHHGILGMKWGVRRFQNKDGSLTAAGKTRYSSDEDDGVTKIRRDRRTARKKKVTEGNGNDLHKRGDGEHYENAFGEVGVGPYDSYHNAVITYGNLGPFTLGYAPVTRQLGEALKTAILHEIMEMEEYRDILKSTEDLEKLVEERKKAWKQGSAAATMIVEKKISDIIDKINANLTALDVKYYDKTKLVKEAVNKTYTPSKDLLDFLMPSSNILNVDTKTGRVSKAWKTSATPTNAKGYKL